MIDIEKVKQKIDFLKEGKTLFINHMCYGKFKVYMNPQHNGIFAEPIDSVAKEHERKCVVKTHEGILYITRDSVVASIEQFIMWGYGDWTVEIEPKVEGMQLVVLSEGVYERI